MNDELTTNLTREQAFEILNRYNKEEFHIIHGQTLERLMRFFAEHFDAEHVEFWGQVGLLHDLDWEVCDGDQDHTICAGRLLREAGASERLIHAIQTHNSDFNPDLPKPEHKMECVLFMCDETSGLIDACVRLRPSHSPQDLEFKSLKKKFKNKKFAAGCGREQMTLGAEYNHDDIDTALAAILAACKLTDPARAEFLSENPDYLEAHPEDAEETLKEQAYAL